MINSCVLGIAMHPACDASRSYESCLTLPIPGNRQRWSAEGRRLPASRTPRGPMTPGEGRGPAGRCRPATSKSPQPGLNEQTTLRCTSDGAALAFLVWLIPEPFKFTCTRPPRSLHPRPRLPRPPRPHHLELPPRPPWPQVAAPMPHPSGTQTSA